MIKPSLELNQAAVSNPEVGDYWHEMLVPYFLIVDKKGDKYTILSAWEKPGVKKALVEVENSNGEYSEWDYSKSSIVDKEWIETEVKYKTSSNSTLINPFVAYVSRSGKRFLKMVEEWRNYQEKNRKAEAYWWRGV